jgi:diadenosine tetraphosphate (Ap4A) HIT family hydrolase
MCSEYQYPDQSYFYNKIGGKYNIHCRIIAETKFWYAIPTIGCITVGYVLLVCKEHYNCLAEVPCEIYCDFLYLKKEITDRIYKKTGMKCISFEHGSKSNINKGANSIEHVHFHVVPSKTILWKKVIEYTELPIVKEIPSIADLSNQIQVVNECDSYLFLEDIDYKCYFINDASKFPSQFFRIILAKSMDIDNMWDWRKYTFEGNIIRTLYILK